jgi:hypothetical protein
VPTAATGCSQAIASADRTWCATSMSSRAHISRRDRLLDEIGMLKGMRPVRIRTVDSDKVYAAVGKVIVDATFTEWSAAQLVAAVNGEDRFYGEDLCRRNKVMRELLMAAESDAELAPLYTEIADLRERRNELAHAVGMVTSDARGRKMFLYFRPLRDDEAAEDQDDLTKYPSDILDLAREVGVAIGRLARITQERSEVSVT